MEHFWTAQGWVDLVKKEPRLAHLEEEIIRFRATRKRLGSCVTGDWYSRFKPQVYRLVGIGAKTPELRSECAYRVAYHYLNDLLTNRKVKPVSRMKSKGRVQAEGH